MADSADSYNYIVVHRGNPGYDLFTWASVDVLQAITGESAEKILADEAKKKAGWKPISDEEVLKPGGRLYQTYQEVAQNIRRTIVAEVEKSPRNPRRIIRALAAQVLECHVDFRKNLVEKFGEEHETVVFLDKQVASIKREFPDLASSMAEEIKFLMTLLKGGAA
jgi:hypothetical protein